MIFVAGSPSQRVMGVYFVYFRSVVVTSPEFATMYWLFAAVMIVAP